MKPVGVVVPMNSEPRATALSTSPPEVSDTWLPTLVEKAAKVVWVIGATVGT